MLTLKTGLPHLLPLLVFSLTIFCALKAGISESISVLKTVRQCDFLSTLKTEVALGIENVWQWTVQPLDSN